MDFWVYQELYWRQPDQLLAYCIPHQISRQSSNSCRAGGEYL